MGQVKNLFAVSIAGERLKIRERVGKMRGTRVAGSHFYVMSEPPLNFIERASPLRGGNFDARRPTNEERFFTRSKNSELLQEK